jgi:riboflavin kinase/FMN adenylyltransferase
VALKIIHGWKHLDPADQGAAVALGNFDGVHLGHQEVIAEAAEGVKARYAMAELTW